MENKLIRNLVVGDYVLVNEKIRDMDKSLESVIGKWQRISSVPHKYSAISTSWFVYTLEGHESTLFSIKDFNIYQTNKRMLSPISVPEIKGLPSLPNI